MALLMEGSSSVLMTFVLICCGMQISEAFSLTGSLIPRPSKKELGSGDETTSLAASWADIIILVTLDFCYSQLFLACMVNSSVAFNAQTLILFVQDRVHPVVQLSRYHPQGLLNVYSTSTTPDTP